MKNKLASPGLKLLVLILINILLIENDIQVYISPNILLGILMFSLILHLWSFDKVGYVLLPFVFSLIHCVLQMKISDKFCLFFTDYFWKEGEQLRELIGEKINNLNIEVKSKGLIHNLLLANKSFMNEDMKERVSQIGGAHLLAVSGMHLGIIYFIANSVLSKILWFKKEVKLIVLAILLIFYAYLTGFNVPIVRALIMVLIIIFGELFSKKHDSLNTLFVSASLLILYEPGEVKSWSFQFSFIGVLGIILGLRYFYQFKSGNIFLKALVNLILVSLYAQLFLCPLLLYYFGSISTYFLITSIVLTPIIYTLIFLSIILCIIDLKPLIFLVEKLTNFIDVFSHFICRLPMSTIEINDLDWIQLFLLYLLIFTAKTLIITKKYWILNVLLVEVYVLFKI